MHRFLPFSARVSAILRKTALTLLPLTLAHLCPADTLAEQQRISDALAKATDYMRSISTHGGYLWQYSEDLSQRAGESPAPDTIIWFESPGTAAMGGAFLRAWETTADPQYLDAAREVIDSLAHCQLASGGWHYSGSFSADVANKDGAPDYKGARVLARPGSDPDKLYPLYRVATTFDDDVTQNCVRFLIDYVAATRDLNDPLDNTARTVLSRALEGMLRAQYPNGAWPERYEGALRNPANHPVQAATLDNSWPKQWPAQTEGEYVNFYTLNDRSQRDCMRTMLHAANKLGREDCLEAARRGGDFLLLAQFPKPSAGWAQQYDFAMRPAWGRVFEVPGVSSKETATALEALLDLWLETGDEKYLQPFDGALEWLETVQVAPNRWARVYELGTNRPIYGDMDGKIHASLATVSKERREGYNWESDYGIPKFIAHYNAIRARGRDAWLEARKSPRPRSLSRLRPAAETALAALDEQGRWLVPGTPGKKPNPNSTERMISTADYIRNVNLLCNTLTALKSENEAQQ